MVIGPGVKTGLNIRLAVQSQVGADIVADAVAALESFQAPIITIDMGTATTIGVISEGRTYEGGMLLPGVNVSLEALSRRAAQLPAISLQAPKSLIGSQQRIVCVQASFMEPPPCWMESLTVSVRNFMEKRSASWPQGGSAPFIVKFCHNPIVYDKTLLMKGLWAIYKKESIKAKRPIYHGAFGFYLIFPFAAFYQAPEYVTRGLPLRQHAEPHCQCAYISP